MLIGLGGTGFLALQEAQRRQRAELARIEEAKENDRKRAESLVEAVLTAPAQGVPYGMANLETLHEYAVAKLRKRFEDQMGAPVRRLRAAFALAKFGIVEVDFIVSQVKDSLPDEAENFVVALERSNATAVSALEAATRTADSEKNWRHKARLAMLAMLAMHLNSPALVKAACCAVGRSGSPTKSI